MYADDTVVYASGNTSTSVADKLNANLDKISSRLSSSCLTLNKNKKNSVCAYPLKKLPLSQLLNVQINGELIEQVSEVSGNNYRLSVEFFNSYQDNL